MPTRFVAFHQHSGFHDAAPPLLVVPYRGTGLVKLSNVKSFNIQRDLRFNRNDLTVRDVTGEASKSVVDYAQDFPATLRDEYTAAHIRHGLHGSVLLSIEGKRPHHSTFLDYASRHIRATLLVYIAALRQVTISFRFVHHLDANGAMTSGTKHDPSLAEKLVAFLNRLYFPATNIEFELKSALSININRKLDDPVNQAQFKAFLIPQKDTAAEMTIFFTGKFRNDMGGEGLSDLKAVCSVVSDYPTRDHFPPETTWPSKSPTFEQSEDWLDEKIRFDVHNIPRGSTDRHLHWEVAHEVGHLLGDHGHNQEEEHLMTEYPREGLKMDLPFIRMIHR